VPGGRGGSTERVFWDYDEWSSLPPPATPGRWATREQGFGECKGSYWLVFELESRDFMHYMARRYGASLFAIPEDTPDLSTDTEAVKRLNCWKEGMTGVPLGVSAAKV
jgi:deoxyribodipyrimidine photolyase